MKSFSSASLLSDPKSRSCLCLLFVTATLICGVYFIGSAWLGNDYFTLSPRLKLNGTWQHSDYGKCKVTSTVEIKANDASEDTNPEKCNEKCIPSGSEALPKGIVSRTSDLEMVPLWGPVSEDDSLKHKRQLLAMAVGIKQKGLVEKIVEKFLANDFVIMLFHYDGAVNEWNDLQWNDRVIHVSAMNQTKWWFAKRFLHPDIVAEYDYIFVWDEDLGVQNFNPGRYLDIVKEEGLEISQPGLDLRKSEVHHQITVRKGRSRVHRRYYKFKGGVKCDANSTSPPCVGWVEMMAPVFSRAAWRCAWYMIQNDLIHAWGLDMQLGYCAQGDRSVKVGVVDEEYIVHMGIPSLGGSSHQKKDTEIPDQSSVSKNSSDPGLSADSGASKLSNRSAVRARSYAEMRIFRNRWSKAAKEDKCWVDPYDQSKKQKIN